MMHKKILSHPKTGSKNILYVVRAIFFLLPQPELFFVTVYSFCLLNFSCYALMIGQSSKSTSPCHNEGQHPGWAHSWTRTNI